MLRDHLDLAWRSIRRTPWFSFLIVLGIALGVGVSTSFLTVHHVLAADPLPGRSQDLYYVRLDSWDPAQPHPSPSGVPPQITYRDMREIMKSDLPRRQTAGFQSRLPVFPPDGDPRATLEPVRLVFADFFPMFKVPFRYGGPWDRNADAKPEAVVVISSQLNERLFGGADSVGRSLRLRDREFRVIGVLAPWRPRVRFYDPTQSGISDPEDVYLPFNWVEPMEISTSGNSDGWITVPADNSDSFVEALRGTEQTWLQMWVELESPAKAAAYHDFLNAYVLEQKKLGRFARPLNNRVTPMMAFLDELGVVPAQVRALAVISTLFLVVAALNLIGLFLGKFLARSSVVGVRRAMGASRGSIFMQHFVECELIGLIGGALGLALSTAILALLSRSIIGRMPNITVKDFFALDGTMVLAALGLSLFAGAIAGLYPSWRICVIPPAQHLKSQ